MSKKIDMSAFVGREFDCEFSADSSFDDKYIALLGGIAPETG